MYFGEDTGPLNLIELNGLSGQAVLGGFVSTGSTVSVVQVNNAGSVSLAVNAYQKGTLRIFTGPDSFVESIVQSNDANSFTVSPDLAVPPVEGLQYVVIPAVLDITVNAPENIAQVDGASVAYSSLLSPNTAMSAPAAVSVGTVAVRLDTGLANRRYITIVNNGTAAIYVGGANTVTTATGLPIAAGASATYNLGPSLQLWGISTATQDVRPLEVA